MSEAFEHVAAFPLCWPDGWARTGSRQSGSKFGDWTVYAASVDLREELRKMGVQNVTVSTSVPLRRGEICALKWSDLDRRRGELRIVRQLQPQKGLGVVEEQLKSESSRRTMQLPAKLIDALDKRGDLDNEYICTHNSERWVPNTLDGFFRKRELRAA